MKTIMYLNLNKLKQFIFYEKVIQSPCLRVSVYRHNCHYYKTLSFSELTSIFPQDPTATSSDVKKGKGDRFQFIVGLKHVISFAKRPRQ